MIEELGSGGGGGGGYPIDAAEHALAGVVEAVVKTAARAAAPAAMLTFGAGKRDLANETRREGCTQ